MSKFIKKRLVIMTAFLAVVLAAQAYGAGIVLKIPKDGLKDYNNADMDPNYGASGYTGSTNIEFFTGSVPAPNLTTGRFAPNYTWLPNAQIHQYDDTTINGGNVYMRIWDGAPRTQGSYYGKSPGYAAASGSTPAKQHDVASFKADFLADVPINAPTINRAGISESNRRIGETTNVVLALSVPFSYDMGTPKVEATGFDFKFWKEEESEPADDDTTRVVSLSGSPFNLPDQDAKNNNQPFGAGTYHFRVRAKNWYNGGPWSATENWTTLSGAGVAGMPDSVTLNLLKKEGDFGVNSIGITFATIYDGTGMQVSTLQDLVVAINNAGSGYVSTIGYWDKETQTEVGFTFNDAGGVIDRINTDKNPNEIGLVKGEGYQVSVTEDKTVTLRNTP
jgi:hypothetical protein